MLVDINEPTIKRYQDSLEDAREDRVRTIREIAEDYRCNLRENTTPKSINEEVGFLLRLMDVLGGFTGF